MAPAGRASAGSSRTHAVTNVHANHPLKHPLPIKIYEVASRETGAVYHLAWPSADTDMATDGVVVLAGADGREIQVHKANKEEYDLGSEEGGRRLAARERGRQGRDDLRLVRAADPDGTLGGPFAFYDLLSGGTADVVAPVSHEAFVARAGRLVDAL